MTASTILDGQPVHETWKYPPQMEARRRVCNGGAHACQNLFISKMFRTSLVVKGSGIRGFDNTFYRKTSIRKRFLPPLLIYDIPMIRTKHKLRQNLQNDKRNRQRHVFAIEQETHPLHISCSMEQLRDIAYVGSQPIRRFQTQ